MFVFESRSIRGTENMHLSRVVYYGVGNIEMEEKKYRVREIMVERLKRDDFSLIESYDGKKDLLIVPKGIKAMKELRDKVYTITEKKNNNL